jgi:EAL domain-containing protein (putative c-di-GMP-specific phosphodiesterase class I)
LGIRIAVTGFGSASFSLMSMNRLPIDEVRVESKLIKHMNKSKDDQKLIRGIIQIADYLELDIIAVGVEKKQQLHKLQTFYDRYECKQGFSQHKSIAVDKASLGSIKPSFT